MIIIYIYIVFLLRLLEGLANFIMLYMNRAKIFKSNPSLDTPVDITKKGFGCGIDI